MAAGVVRPTLGGAARPALVAGRAFFIPFLAGESALVNCLSPRQMDFAREYLKDFDPQAAATRAGYTHRGARATGQRLLRQQAIRDALLAEREGYDRTEENTGLAPVLRELTAIATDREGTAPRERLKALELLGRSLGLFKEPADAPEQDLVERILEARRRVEDRNDGPTSIQLKTMTNGP